MPRPLAIRADALPGHGRIRRALRRRGLSLDSAAMLLDCSPGVLSRLGTPRADRPGEWHQPSLGLATALQRALGVAPDAWMPPKKK